MIEVLKLMLVIATFLILIIGRKSNNVLKTFISMNAFFKISVAITVIFFFNLFLLNSELHIAMNVFNIVIIAFLGIPGFGLVILLNTFNFI